MAKKRLQRPLCRTVASTPDGGEIEIWGDGKQSRSFLYIDECVDGIRKLIESDFSGSVNIGSEEMITINDFAKMIIGLSGKSIRIKNIPGPTGVRGRNSDNRLIREKLNWAPGAKLKDGVEKTFEWISTQLGEVASERQGNDKRRVVA